MALGVTIGITDHNRLYGLVKLQRRHRDMVKNGQKLKKGSFFFIKTLTLEMSPIGMIQEARKKTEIRPAFGQRRVRPWATSFQEI